MKKLKKIKLIIILSLAIAIFTSGYALAKYSISKELKSSSKIAIPILEVAGTETTKINAINNIGYYDFIVKNYNDEIISEVQQEYNIEVISNTDESIAFELYNGDIPIELTNNKTEKISIKGGEREEHNYRLKVCYDKNKSNSTNDILEDVQIKVHSEQSNIRL